MKYRNGRRKHILMILAAVLCGVLILSLCTGCGKTAGDAQRSGSEKETAGSGKTGAEESGGKDAEGKTSGVSAAGESGAQSSGEETTEVQNPDEENPERTEEESGKTGEEPSAEEKTTTHNPNENNPEKTTKETRDEVEENTTAIEDSTAHKTEESGKSTDTETTEGETENKTKNSEKSTSETTERTEAAGTRTEQGDSACYQTVLSGNADDRLFFYGYSRLSDQHKKVYNILSKAISEKEQTVEIDKAFGLSFDDISRILNAVRDDQPEYFYYNGNGSVVTAEKVVTRVTFKYTYSGNLNAMEQEYRQAAAQVIAATQGMTAFEKERYVYDYLCRTVVYKDGPNDQCPYQCLVKHAAVCNGYARAFQYLMLSCGVPCYFCTGNAAPKSGSAESHAWNIVVLDGEGYFADVTWGDATDHGYIEYEYLNQPAEAFLKSHTPGAEYPACRGTKYTVEAQYGAPAALYTTLCYGETNRYLTSLEDYKNYFFSAGFERPGEENHLVFVCNEALYGEIPAYLSSQEFSDDLNARLAGTPYEFYRRATSYSSATLNGEYYVFEQIFTLTAE